MHNGNLRPLSRDTRFRAKNMENHMGKTVDN